MRTNSEAILAVTLPRDAPDITRRIAITGSIYPDPDTHIETVVYGDAADSMSALYTVMVGDGTRVTRPLKLLKAAARHPLTFLGLFNPRGWSRRTIIVLVMQTVDNAIALRAKRTRRGVRLQTEQNPERPIPTYLSVANEFGDVARQAHRRRRAELVDGGAGEHPDDRPRARRRGDRRRSVIAAWSTPTSACSATRTCSCATAPRCPPTSA